MTNPYLEIDGEGGEPSFTTFEEALLNVVKTREGRAVVWEMLNQANVYGENFHGNSTDIYEKGKRALGLWLIRSLDRVDVTAYPRMMLDVAKQQERDKERDVAQQDI